MAWSTKKLALIALVGVLLVALYVFLPLLTTPQPTLPLATVTLASPSGPVRVSAEVADDPVERSRGLAFRESLAEGAAMLFVWPDEGVRSIWMRDTRFPLDVLFIGADLTVVHIVEGLQPCEADPCPLFDSGAPAQYALEVNADFVRRHGIRVGALVTIET
ncbi:MAG: DUF192 domain-containing protein [Thermoplasmata archaeon]